MHLLLNEYSRDMNAGAMSEYNKAGKTAKIRQEFAAGTMEMALYTERFHFFRRLRIKGQWEEMALSCDERGWKHKGEGEMRNYFSAH